MTSADNPILNSPYGEPTRHYATAAQGNVKYRDTRYVDYFLVLAPGRNRR